MFYAQLDEKGKVHTVCVLASSIESQHLVPIENLDESLIGSYYDPQSGTFKQVTAFANTTSIKADGQDVAIITANVPTLFAEITFYHADTGQPIATVPVDPETHTATLQVTATTPGVIRIRAGEPTMTRLNEVTIHAVEAS